MIQDAATMAQFVNAGCCNESLLHMKNANSSSKVGSSNFECGNVMKQDCFAQIETKTLASTSVGTGSGIKAVDLQGNWIPLH